MKKLTFLVFCFFNIQLFAQNQSNLTTKKTFDVTSVKPKINQ